MQRILIIGNSGAGKSTLARQLGQLLQLEVIHLDQHFFGPNWVEPDRKVWEERVRKLIRRDAWVMDGNYGGTMELRMERADCVIFLDFSRWVSLWRALKRVRRERGKVRADVAPGCVEGMDWRFFWYIFRYPDTRRPGVMRRLENMDASKKRIILRSPRQVRAFLKELESTISA